MLHMLTVNTCAHGDGTIFCVALPLDTVSSAFTKDGKYLLFFASRTYLWNEWILFKSLFFICWFWQLHSTFLKSFFSFNFSLLQFFFFVKKGPFQETECGLCFFSRFFSYFVRTQNHFIFWRPSWLFFVMVEFFFLPWSLFSHWHCVEEFFFVFVFFVFVCVFR